MAGEKKEIPVKTFVAEIPPLGIAEYIEKFQGRRTLRTLAAAKRILAKKKFVKIPRNLLRQLWIATGGWNNPETQPKPGWIDSENYIKNGCWCYPTNGYTYRKVELAGGQLVAYGYYSPTEKNHNPVVFVGYRGRRVATLGGEGWLNKDNGYRGFLVRRFFIALGQDVGGQPVTEK